MCNTNISKYQAGLLFLSSKKKYLNGSHFIHFCHIVLYESLVVIVFLSFVIHMSARWWDLPLLTFWYPGFVTDCKMLCPWWIINMLLKLLNVKQSPSVATVICIVIIKHIVMFAILTFRATQLSYPVPLMRPKRSKRVRLFNGFTALKYCYGVIYLWPHVIM